jgi:hypothetical protein
LITPKGTTYRDLKEKTFEVTVVEAIRGTAAYQRLIAVNQFNAPPLPGYEWLLFKVRVHYISGPSGAAVRIDWTNAPVLTAAGATYQHHSAVGPSPSFDFQLFPGATAEGWEAWQVRTDDPGPLLLFGADILTLRGGLWLSLSPTR